MELRSLLAEEGEEYNTAWKLLMFDLGKVLELKALIPDLATANALLQAGSRYTGVGWCTSRASRALYQASGVAVVKGDFTEYRNAFLFAMDMLLKVEVPPLELTKKTGWGGLRHRVYR